MKIYSADLQALLDANVPVYRVDLFKIGPCRNGGMIYATSGQVSLTFGGNVYDPGKYGSWSRGSVTLKIGLESNGTQLTVLADNQVPIYFPGTSNAVLLVDGLKLGLLGRAAVTLSTAYFSPHLAGYAYGSMTGPTGGSLVETKFVGETTGVSPAGMTKAHIEVRDLLYLLNIQVPRHVLQPSCTHILYDAGCTLSAAAFTRTGAVAAVTYPYQFTTTAHIVPISGAGTFTQGVLTWNSGANSGLSSFVRAWTAGGSSDTIQLDVQPPFPIAAGDAFSLRQGCNKTFTSCADMQGSVNSYVNYGGEPDVPVPETAIG